MDFDFDMDEEELYRHVLPPAWSRRHVDFVDKLIHFNRVKPSGSRGLISRAHGWSNDFVTKEGQGNDITSRAVFKTGACNIPSPGGAKISNENGLARTLAYAREERVQYRKK